MKSLCKLYFVGGAVRDEIMGGANPKDKDIVCVGCSWDEMKQEILKRNGVIYVEKPEYLTIRCNLKEIGPADFVLARNDGFYSDGRRPDSVKGGTLFEDLSRRDFTVNAIAKDVETGEIIDPFGGISDIKIKVLRCVGEPEERFREDSLRILRAVRFKITKGFAFSSPIICCLTNKEILNLLKNVSIERIREELNKCFRFNSYETLLFFEIYSSLRDILFKNTKLWLEPTLKEV